MSGLSLFQLPFKVKDSITLHDCPLSPLPMPPAAADTPTRFLGSFFGKLLMVRTKDGVIERRTVSFVELGCAAHAARSCYAEYVRPVEELGRLHTRYGGRHHLIVPNNSDSIFIKWCGPRWLRQFLGVPTDANEMGLEGRMGQPYLGEKKQEGGEWALQPPPPIAQLISNASAWVCRKMCLSIWIG